MAESRAASGRVASNWNSFSKCSKAAPSIQANPVSLKRYLLKMYTLLFPEKRGRGKRPAKKKMEVVALKKVFSDLKVEMWQNSEVTGV